MGPGKAKVTREPWKQAPMGRLSEHECSDTSDAEEDYEVLSEGGSSEDEGDGEDKQMGNDAPEALVVVGAVPSSPPILPSSLGHKILQRENARVFFQSLWEGGGEVMQQECILHDHVEPCREFCTEHLVPDKSLCDPVQQQQNQFKDTNKAQPLSLKEEKHDTPSSGESSDLLEQIKLLWHIAAGERRSHTKQLCLLENKIQDITLLLEHEKKAHETTRCIMAADKKMSAKAIDNLRQQYERQLLEMKAQHKRELEELCEAQQLFVALLEEDLQELNEKVVTLEANLVEEKAKLKSITRAAQVVSCENVEWQ